MARAGEFILSALRKAQGSRKAKRRNPALGRFAQADTIVPAGVQGLDRYAYVNNNPLRNTDPSGHSPCEDWGACANINSSTTTSTSTTTSKDPYRNPPVNGESQYFCSSTLANCFGDEVLYNNFSENTEDNPIPIDEFEAFEDKVAEDLFTHTRSWPGYTTGRGAYDTPFYNGGNSERRTRMPGSENGIWPGDQRVCIETLGCFGRSEINYIAQGMWGASVGEPKWVTMVIVWTWKVEEYFETPSSGTYYWTNYGYDYYKEWFNNYTK